MLTNECCPQCGREADSSRVRLVRDSCGHKKCRECLLSDEASCLLCSSYTPVYTELKPAHGCQSRPIEPVLSTAPSETVPTPILLTQEIPTTQEDTLTLSQPPDHCTNPNTQDCTQPEDAEENTDDSSSKNFSVKKLPTFGLKDHIVFTPGNPPKYTCKKCDKSYNNRKAARYHNYCGASNTEKPHTCDECGLGFITKGHLVYHIKSHTGSLPFTCSTCGKGFKQQSKLNRHYKSHEASEKPFKCDKCEKAFSTKQILKDHMLSHAQGHFVTCPICSKKLSSQSCLRKHKKLHADPIHKCKDCGKKFPVKWSLDVHQKTHQRERKFKCKECPKAFKILSDLKRHGFVHQDGEWECKTCQLIFRRRDNLVRHLKNIHPEVPVNESMRQRNGKDDDDDEDEPDKSEESCAMSSTAFSHAVSVIRAVPVIQKAKARSFITQETELVAHNRLDVNAVQSTQQTRQNFQRQSVVCHSDSRGVVRHGSASCESTYRMDDCTPRNYESSVEVSQPPASRGSSTVDCDDSVVQNNVIQRPRVIVAMDN
ncbi:zinc finger protein 30 isoform X2 [Frankliniella occidentalis]|uniref:Zinc finger protein 30 isoform X2 n=1 Tax=Frankliniella occidentalis TaxID=133901 RepID=A0A9C6X7N7_FRAOC|nr:zinc finger protein 30 isoform X2 [Frankliniella occidentalis]